MWPTNLCSVMHCIQLTRCQSVCWMAYLPINSLYQSEKQKEIWKNNLKKKAKNFLNKAVISITILTDLQQHAEPQWPWSTQPHHGSQPSRHNQDLENTSSSRIATSCSKGLPQLWPGTTRRAAQPCLLQINCLHQEEGNGDRTNVLLWCSISAGQLHFSLACCSPVYGCTRYNTETQRGHEQVSDKALLLSCLHSSFREFTVHKKEAADAKPADCLSSRWEDCFKSQ